MSSKRSIALQGNLTVGYHREGREWFATALQFDIMGYGRTKAKAFQLMQELVSEYLQEMARLIAEGEKVRFFNPSSAEDWDRMVELEEYHVRLTMAFNQAARPTALTPSGLQELIEYIDSLDEMEVDLVPA